MFIHETLNLLQDLLRFFVTLRAPIVEDCTDECRDTSWTFSSAVIASYIAVVCWVKTVNLRTHRLLTRPRSRPYCPESTVSANVRGRLDLFTIYSGLTLIQSLFLPFKMYSESGCLITRPSPLDAITSSIFCRTSLAVLPSNSAVNSMRPGTSLMHARKLRLRNLSDFWWRDMPLR